MSDVYKIGVEIALTNSISGALSTITGQLLGMKGHIKDIETGFSKIGLVGAAVGVGMLAISKILLDNGGELQKQIGQMNNLLSNSKDSALNVAAALKLATTTPGTTVAQNVGLISHILPSLEDVQQAREILPRILKDAIAASGTTGMPIEDLVSQAMKAIDLTKQNVDPKTGRFDPARAASAFHEIVSTLKAGGGNINMNDVLRYAQQAATYSSLTTDEKLFWQSAMGPMLEMGGSKAGTSIQALGRQLVAGRGSKAAALHLESLGLLDPNHIKFLGGGTASVDKDGYAGGKLLDEGNFATWFQDYFKPAVDKKKGGKATQKDYIQEIAASMSKDTAARVASLFILSEAQFKRDQELVKTVSSKDLYGNMMKTDLGANQNALSTSTQTFLQVLGDPLVPSAISGLQGLTSAVSFFTEFVTSHPSAGTSPKSNLVLGAAGAPGMFTVRKMLEWFGPLGGGTAPSGAGPSRQTVQDGLPYTLDGNKVVRRYMDPGIASNPTPVNVTMTPQIQATNTINIDGKALASYVTQMVIKSISGLIPHPTGAPMAGTSQFAPAFDSGRR